MKYPNNIKHLLRILILLVVLLMVYAFWLGYENQKSQAAQDQFKRDFAALAGALEEAHEENPNEVPSPEDIVETPPEVIREFISPSAEQVYSAITEWFHNNPVRDHLDPNDPEIQDFEIQDAEFQDPEIDDPEIQDPEIQDPEIDDPEIQDDEIQDPEIQDPEIDDPDPAMSAFVFSFEFANKTYTVTCSDPDGDRLYSCEMTEV